MQNDVFYETISHRVSSACIWTLLVMYGFSGMSFLESIYTMISICSRIKWSIMLIICRGVILRKVLTLVWIWFVSSQICFCYEVWIPKQSCNQLNIRSLLFHLVVLPFLAVDYWFLLGYIGNDHCHCHHLMWTKLLMNWNWCLKSDDCGIWNNFWLMMMVVLMVVENFIHYFI